MNERHRAGADRPATARHEFGEQPAAVGEHNGNGGAMRLPLGSGTAQLRMVHSAALHLVGASSYSLLARPEDDGAMWPALAARCRSALPDRLAWAVALLPNLPP
jgi:hypothetical protein